METQEKRSFPLREIVKHYLELNGLSIRYMSQCMRMPYSTLYMWLQGFSDLADEKLDYIRNIFLQGNFLIPVEQVLTYMSFMKDYEEK